MSVRLSPEEITPGEYARFGQGMEGNVELCMDSKYDSVRPRYARYVSDEFRLPIEPGLFADKKLLCEAIKLIDDNENDPEGIDEYLTILDPRIQSWWRKVRGEEVEEESMGSPGTELEFAL